MLYWLINWTIRNNFQWNLNQNANILLWRKCVWKCHLQNVIHIVWASLCQHHDNKVVMTKWLVMLFWCHNDSVIMRCVMWVYTFILCYSELLSGNIKIRFIIYLKGLYRWNACQVCSFKCVSKIISILSIISNAIYMGLCVFSLGIARLMIVRMFILHLIIIIIKLEISRSLCLCVLMHFVCLISEHRGALGDWNPSPWKALTPSSCMVNSMAVDDLVTQGARASAAMVLHERKTNNIPMSSPEGCASLKYHIYDDKWNLVV